MVPDGTSMPFNKAISMDDGMDITMVQLCRVFFLKIRRLQVENCNITS